MTTATRSANAYTSQHHRWLAHESISPIIRRDALNTASKPVRYFRSAITIGVGLVVALLLALQVRADDAEPPVTLENVGTPGRNDPKEPLAEAFSADKAARFLDVAAVRWQKTFGCMTCHTNYLYLISRPALSSDVPAHQTVREYAEKLVSEQWPKKGPRFDAEVVMTAAMLAGNDARTSGKLHPLTRQALDRIWTVQRDDGGFDWYKACHWPPYEDDDYFGATMAALGVGMAPDKYVDTPAAQSGIKKLLEYFSANEPPSLHHRALLLWASTYWPDFMDKSQQQQCLDSLLALQHEDGGWGIAQLGTWERRDKSPQDTATSDGYGTGFVVLIARRAGVPADDPRIARAVVWLKSHQRASGRWFTRSLYCDAKHYITHAATSFAVMALAECNALDTPEDQAAIPAPGLEAIDRLAGEKRP